MKFLFLLRRFLSFLRSLFSSVISLTFFLFLLIKKKQEFNIEKLQLVEAEKKKIRQEYERKEKQVDIRKRMSVEFHRLFNSFC